MKVLHLTLVRELSRGQRNQLRYEHLAREELHGANWTCVALHCGEAASPFEVRIPVPFRPLFLRNLYAWLWLIGKSRSYDYVLCRYMPFDPFVLLFGWFVPNRISVHHAKEEEELRLVRAGWRGRAAARLERLCGRVSGRQVVGVLGVTDEIARYEAERHRLGCAVAAYPNGIVLADVPVLPDRRSPDELHIAFICGVFSPWQGLDRLIDAVRREPGAARGVTIHLIGRLGEAERRAVDGLSAFVVHGSLAPEAYREILARCDIGLDSLGLDRKRLTETAALKVREYLASGLPVYSLHRDTALPDDYPYYRRGRSSLVDITAYAREMKQVPRARVREDSAAFIDKRRIMERVCLWLRGIRTR